MPSVRSDKSQTRTSSRYFFHVDGLPSHVGTMERRSSPYQSAMAACTEETRYTKYWWYS